VIRAKIEKGKANVEVNGCIGDLIKDSLVFMAGVHDCIRKVNPAGAEEFKELVSFAFESSMVWEISREDAE